ncbi:MAG: PIN domain-containing protein [Treponema sp.]|nr:PIN domain-containing protein [Treponema sp.]
MIYFLDANIISYVMRQVPSVISRLQELIKNSADIRIPIISYYEVKRGLLSNNSMHKLALFDAQMKVFGLVPMRETTFELAAQIYAQLKSAGKLIEDADLFIGCSALEHNAILLTNNSNHLGRIPHLQIEVLN